MFKFVRNIQHRRLKKLSSKNVTVRVSNEICTKPVLSVVSPVFNQKEFIQKCIEGVTSQITNFEFEYIIADDCSTDGTFSIVEGYFRRFQKKIILIERSKNIGSYTKNGRYNNLYALSQCRGKYVAIVEGDDYWTDPLKLQKQYDHLENNPDHVACFHPVRILNDSKKQFLDSFYEPPYSANSYEKVDFLLNSNFVPTCSFVSRNFNEIIPDWFHFIKYDGDFVLHLLNSDRGKYGFLKECMGVYRMHKGGVYGGLTLIAQLKREFDLYILIKKHLIQTAVEKKYLKKYMSKAGCRLAVLYYNSGEFTKSRYFLRLAKKNGSDLSDINEECLRVLNPLTFVLQNNVIFIKSFGLSRWLKHIIRNIIGLFKR